MLLDLQLQELGPQHLHGVIPVLELAPLRLAEDHDARGQVGQADGRGGLVDVLAAGAGGAAGLHLDVVGQLRHDLHRGKGGLPPGVGVKGGHPHETVDAVFAAQEAVGVLPLDGDGGGLDARLVALFIVEGGALEVVALGPAGVHPEEHLRPVLGLGAAGAGVEGEDGAVGIILPGEQGLEPRLLDLGLKLCVFRLDLGQDLLVLGLLAHLAEGHEILPGGDELVLPLDLVLQLLEAHLHLLGPGQVVPEPVLGGLLLQPRGLLLGALNVQGGGELGELRLQGVQLLFIGVVFDHSHGIVSPFPSVSRGMPGAGRQRPGGRPRNAGGLGPSLQYPLLYKTLPAFVKGKSAFWEEKSEFQPSFPGKVLLPTGKRPPGALPGGLGGHSR